MTAFTEELDACEGKLLAAASAAANAAAYLAEELPELTAAIDAALTEARCLQAQYAGDTDATGL